MLGRCVGYLPASLVSGLHFLYLMRFRLGKEPHARGILAWKGDVLYVIRSRSRRTCAFCFFCCQWPVSFLRRKSDPPVPLARKGYISGSLRVELHGGFLGMWKRKKATGLTFSLGKGWLIPHKQKGPGMYV